MKRLRALLITTCLSVGLSVATGAGAAVAVTSVGLVDTYTATITDSAFPGGVDAYLTPLVFNGVIDVFCIDPYHDISTGSVNYLFNNAPLATNSDGALTGTGTPLAATPIGEIGALVDLGEYDLTKNNIVGAAAAQGAIWMLEGASVTPNAGDPAALAGDIASDLIWAQNPAYQTTLPAIYDTRDNVQGFTGTDPGIFGPVPLAPVPEPSTWAMLIAGFALLGFAARRRDPATADLGATSIV